MLNKILYGANGVLSDWTLALQNYYSGVTKAFTFNVAQDAIYIGSKFPFTRKYFKVSSANTTIAGTASISYWDGTQWRAAVEVDDETTNGKPFANSGYLSFVPNKQYTWTRDDTVIAGTGKITGLTSVTIYDMFWIKVTFSAAVPATLAWLGDLFCTDAELASEYPELSRSAVMTAFQSGKTDWEAQRVVASQLAATDLKRLGISASEGKVLTAEQMRRPVVTKTAHVIFSVLEGFQDSAKAAALEYAKRMDPRVFDIDDNETGQDDPAERQVKIHRMTR